MSTKAISIARSSASSCALSGSFLGSGSPTTLMVTKKPTANVILTPTQHCSSNSINNNNIHNHNKSATNTKMPTENGQAQTCKKPELAAKIIQQSHIVCFDVDSTVIQEEGIDELADFCGKGADVARVTKEAMGGAMTFQDALAIRLNIIRPSQQQIVDFVRERPSKLTRNVKRFIEHLKAEGKQVYLISGGFDCLIEPVARELGIATPSNLYANKLLFDSEGNYASFDATQPTSKSGGKAVAIGLIRQKHQQQTAATTPLLITMIGDGATDLEAVPPADYFIGFGGNVVRDGVYQRAQYYVTDFEQLM